MNVEHWRDQVRPFLEGRKVVLAGAPLALYTPALSDLEDLGVASVFLIATGEGTGDLPTEDQATWVVLDTRATNIMEDFRETRAILASPPRRVLQALDAWDPEGDALVMGSPFITMATVAGRRVWGGRPAAWENLEDKVLADEIWDAAGVERAPSRVVPARLDAIEEAVGDLDRGQGAAIAGDASEGFNGGAEYFRWVRGPEDLAEVAGFYSAHCRQVRVMPFLEGIPCSIHGMVFPDRTTSFRPCELVMLRPPSGTRLRYGGAATFWDPEAADREAMRLAALQVGEHLRDRADYRGGFTIDGIMTEEGFRPTELNTRPGAAMGLVTGAVDGLPIGMLQRALVEREDADFRSAELEGLVVEAADRDRRGGGWAILSKRARTTRRAFLVGSATGLEVVEEEPDGPAGTLQFGPGSVGSFLRFEADPGRTPKGPSVAPLVVEAFGAADRVWATGTGGLQAARPAR